MSAAVSEDAWLARILGRPAFRVEAGADASALKALPAKSFAYAKVDARDTAAALRLQDAGFRVVDVSVTFSRPAAAEPLPAPGAPVVRVGQKEAAAVLDIAGSCFRYSRFHLDPRIPPAAAHRVKREWIQSYVSGKRGEALYAVMDGKTPAGFLAVLVIGKEAVIDLIGVGEAFQGKGFGRALVRFFFNEYRAKASELLVGTQAANIPSMRLYESCGFSVAKTALVLHRHA